MKTVSLVACIFLAILLLPLLCITAHASEYNRANTEVNAKEILTHIENGEDIYLDNCEIVGELNTSKLKLKTILNPEYSLFLYMEFSPEEIILQGIKENLSVVESNLTLKNCIFKNDLDFSYTSINGSVDFSGSKFNAPVNFNNSCFKDFVYFTGSTFNDSMYLSKASFETNFYPPDNSFNSSIDFGESTFNGFTDLSGAYFNSSIDFGESTFNGFTDLSGAYFNSSVDFGESTFNAPIRFNDPPDLQLSPNDGLAGETITFFNDSADFIFSTFNAPVYCKGAYFGQEVSFMGSTFDNYTIIHSLFEADSSFRDATFNAPVDFCDSIFEKNPNFDNLTFNDCVNFSNTFFSSSDRINGPEKFKKIITNNEETCDKFRSFFQTEGRYNDADNIYYDFRKVVMNSKKITSLSKLSDFLILITCGYGLRPFRTFFIGGIIIGVFSIIYWQGSGIYKFSDTNEKKSNVSFLDALLFSIREFVTVGSADWYPIDNFRILVTLEGLLGWIMLGIFMATLTTVMIRL